MGSPRRRPIDIEATEPEELLDTDDTDEESSPPPRAKAAVRRARALMEAAPLVTETEATHPSKATEKPRIRR
jgi:hypothetical protein